MEELKAKNAVKPEKTDSRQNERTAIEQKVLSRIVPQEDILPRVNLFIDSFSSVIKSLKLDCRIAIGGSVAKNTHLVNDFDCDLFIRFNPKKYATDEIGGLLAAIVKKKQAAGELLDAQLLHGSRDYYKTVIDGITYELVPTLDVAAASDASNITDMSLFHVDWAVQKCKQYLQRTRRKHQSLNDEIRLAKAFCKAQNVYGAESYIGGFSGHVVDILVIAYGGFEELLEQSYKWVANSDESNKPLIDVESYYSSLKKDPLLLINEAKLTSPIIVIDPIVPSRNAASALTEACLSRFVTAAQEYLKKPSTLFFERTEFDHRSLELLAGVTYKIHLAPLSDKKDIAGAQHVKVLAYICEQAAQHDFAVVGSGWNWSTQFSGDIFVRVEKDTLSPTATVRGPPVSMASAAAAFEAIYSQALQTFEKDDRLWATAKRKFTDFGALLDSLKMHELITVRSKSFSWTKL